MMKNGEGFKVDIDGTRSVSGYKLELGYRFKFVNPEGKETKIDLTPEATISLFSVIEGLLEGNQ